MCKQYFVMRVSSKRVVDRKNKEQELEQQFQQDFLRQKYIFLNAGYDVTEENTYADRITGSSKIEERPRFNELLEKLEEGDTCYFAEVSRFSRDYKNGMEMIDLLIFEKKVNIVFVCDNKTLYAGKRFDASEWFYISMMLLTAEYQKRCIGQSTSQKLQAMKAQGTSLGCPKTHNDAKRQEIVSFYNEGHTMQECADTFGVAVSSVHRFVKESEIVNLVEKITKSQIRTDIPEFQVGDTVRVDVKIIEGKRERIQAFEGLVVAKKGGSVSETFSVRKKSYGIGVTRVFPVNSPAIDKIEVVKKGVVRRAKLNFLKGMKKEFKVKERN